MKLLRSEDGEDPVLFSDNDERPRSNVVKLFLLMRGICFAMRQPCPRQGDVEAPIVFTKRGRLFS
jgi:hypothetical protein